MPQYENLEGNTGTLNLVLIGMRVAHQGKLGVKKLLSLAEHLPMRYNLSFVVFSLMFGVVAFSGCKKSESETPTPNPTGPQLVESLNGYRFEGLIEENDPDRYEFLFPEYIDEYNDSARVFCTSLTKSKVLPEGYKWHCFNVFNGKITRKFYPLDVVMPKFTAFKYVWDHPSFGLHAYKVSESFATLYKPDSTRIGTFVNKPNNTFPYVFCNKFTVFYESQQSVYLFEYGSQTMLNRFLLSSEPSLSYTDTYLDKDYENNGYVFRANFITGFFNPTLTGNYVGIARGGQTLDTLLLDRYDPTIYTNSSSRTFVNKLGDTLHLGVVKRRTADISDELELLVFRILPGETELKPVLPAPVRVGYNVALAFHRGHFYLNGQRMNHSGGLEEVALPKTKAGYIASVLSFGKNKIYVRVPKDEYSFELYSKSY